MPTAPPPMRSWPAEDQEQIAGYLAKMTGLSAADAMVEVRRDRPTSTATASGGDR